MIKRLLDILLSVCGITVVLPFFPLLALFIKLDSKGPVFFFCDRVGKDGTLFKMYKFRTMYETRVRVGPSVCPEGDPRVTPLGRLLRRTKLNELPQLLNILKGDMSFVGPRPEAPDLAALYPQETRAIFTVKPGLVGPNQILGRNEEEWYPPGVDPQTYYIETILPKKLPLDLEYVRHSSAWSDLKFIVLGVKETLFKALSWNLVLQNRSQIYLLLTDLVLSLAVFTLAHALRFGGVPQDHDMHILLQLLPAVAIIRIPCFIYYGLYRTLIRYLSYQDIVGVLKSVSAGSILLVSLTLLSNFRSFSRLAFLIDWICLVLVMSLLRSVLRHYWDRHAKGSESANKRRVLIFGAGDTGALAYRSLMAENGTAFEVVGFLDDDPVKRHKTLYGKKVLGNCYTLGAVVQLYQVDDILLPMPSATPHEIAKVMQACQQAGVRVQLLPTLKTTSFASLPFRQVALADLFEAQDMEMDITAAQRLLQGKRVLLTSACGELGVELCRQILRCDPQKLIIIDRYESYLTELMSHLVNVLPADRVVPVLWSDSNEKVSEVFLEYQPHVVFHTATRKYLPFFDIQVEDVIRVNYLSTFELAKRAAHSGCDYFVMISSEEAGKRGNAIADSLRAAEISLRQFFATQPTTLVTVRLCDILENRGGVVTILEEQIARREPVTLPYPDATCHFLSKCAAAHFILQALTLAEATPAEEGIFVYNNGTPIPLLEVANRLAMLNGVQLNSDLSVKFLHRNSQHGALTAPIYDHERLVATAHARISLLRETSLSDSPECSLAAQHLLNLEEQHLAHAVLWEEHMHTLLRLESVA